MNLLDRLWTNRTNIAYFSCFNLLYSSFV